MTSVTSGYFCPSLRPRLMNISFLGNGHYKCEQVTDSHCT